MRQIRVFLLDDHELVRRGLVDLLGTSPDIDVVGEAATAAAAMEIAPKVDPDVAILDVRLPDGDGISVCRDLLSLMPNLRCSMLTSYDDDEAMIRAVLAGASGYVLKNIVGNDLIAGVRIAAAGGSLLNPVAVAKLTEALKASSSRQSQLESLTPQERSILELIGEGLTNKQIGERLFLAEKTVKNYVSSIFAKLGLDRRTQAAVLAAELFK